MHRTYKNTKLEAIVHSKRPIRQKQNSQTKVYKTKVYKNIIEFVLVIYRAWLGGYWEECRHYSLNLLHLEGIVQQGWGLLLTCIYVVLIQSFTTHTHHNINIYTYTLFPHPYCKHSCQLGRNSGILRGWGYKLSTSPAGKIFCKGHSWNSLRWQLLDLEDRQSS